MNIADSTKPESEELRLSGFLVRISWGQLDHYRRELSIVDRATAVTTLARALAAAPSLGKPDATLLFRLAPEPVLAIVGRFTEKQSATIAFRVRTVGPSCGALRWIDYAEAADACDRLSARLEALLTKEELQRARFVAIPRGGLLILGMVAIRMNLNHDRLQAPEDPEDLTVVIDDCALSGRRFHSFLAGHPGRMVFAPLFSAPELRARIEHEEERVMHCVSGADLAPCQAASNPLPPLTDGAYWYGETEALAFPWNEPDRFIWDPIHDIRITAPPIVPPDRCIKNRALSSDNPLPVQRTDSGTGPLRPADSTLYGGLLGGTVLINTETGRIALLSDTAADSWDRIVGHGALSQAVSELAGSYGIGTTALASDLEELVDELLDQGFLFSCPQG